MKRIFLLLLLLFMFPLKAYAMPTEITSEQWEKIYANPTYRKFCSDAFTNDAKFVILESSVYDRLDIAVYKYNSELFIDAVDGMPKIKLADGTITRNMGNTGTVQVLNDGSVKSGTGDYAFYMSQNSSYTMQYVMSSYGYKLFGSNVAVNTSKGDVFFSLKFPSGFRGKWYDAGGSGRDGVPTDENSTGGGIIDSLVAGIGDALNSILEAISGLVDALIKALKDLLMALFVPKDGFFQANIESFRDKLSQKFGIEQQVQSLNQLNSVKSQTIQDIPVSTRYGSASLDMKFLRDGAVYIKPIVSALYALIILNFIFRKVYSLIRGEQF